MILEAFSQELQSEENRGQAPERVLYAWLTRLLRQPPVPNDHVSQVIHAEIAMIEPASARDAVIFEGRSDSGNRLLVSLFNYCRSFDHWQFTKWLHHVQASDFYCP